LLAAELGISFASVARIWRKWNIQPHRVETFKFSTDPQLESKIRDVVGLTSTRPRARWWPASMRSPRSRPSTGLSRCCRCDPDCPPGRPTTTSATAPPRCSPPVEVATGRITADACYPRHRHQEFLKKTAAAHPDVDLHVVCDNYATHKHPKVKAWLKGNPRVTLHFTPTGCSWMNMVEIFFGIITRQAIRRGTFTSVKELTAAIGAFIDAYNQRCQPFAWTKDADQILAKAARAAGGHPRDSAP
jgi:transposase